MAARKSTKPKSWLHYAAIGMIMIAFAMIAATSRANDLRLDELLWAA